MEDFRGEKIKSSNAVKEVWNYHDTANGIEQISREVFKKKDQIIHYPRGFDGGHKYKTIRTFTFVGFKGKLPVGVVKSVNFGWGFTKALNPFTFFINDNFKFDGVIINKKGKVEMDRKNNKLYLNEKSLVMLNNSFRNIYKKNRGEVDFLLSSILHDLFPTDIKKPKKTYIENALATSLSSWGNKIDEFSTADKEAIKELFDKLSMSTDFLTKDSLAKTKEIVDSKYIKATLDKYKTLMDLKTESSNLESQWQEFLRDNSWVFSSIFAHPVIMYQREAFVGGKAVDNTNGKFNDFLIKNSLSDNVSFLEIKTHKTSLLSSKAYRGNDVFSVSKDLSGSVVQVLNQRDNFQKEFYAIKAKSVKKGNIESFNSKCVVLIGSTDGMTDEQKYSFELYRSNSRDVEILTFDELRVKIESLQKVMST